jgi:N6-adenosine-specific RNA methylase IME4
MSPANHPALIRLSNAEQALANASDLSDFKKIIDIAEAARTYVKAAKIGEGAARKAEEIKLRAQRGAGLFLAKLEKDRGGDRKSSSQPPKLISQYRHAIRSAEISKDAASRYQQVAAVPEPKFAGYLKEARNSKKEATTAGLLREAKQDVKAQKKEAVVEQIRNEPEPLPEGPFRVIVADPPWPYASRADDATHRARNPYPDMTLEAIRDKGEEVRARAADDCVLWLWTTNAFLREGFTVLDAWGFDQKTMLTWVKTQMGTGDWLRGITEHCLLAIKGKPLVTLTNQTTALIAPRGKHSAKPVEFYALVESLCPGAKLEMFARAKREGWKQWGAEAE